MDDWIEGVKLIAAKQSGALGQPRHALVTSVDAVAHAVKVSIQPDGIESGWIPDGAVAAGGMKICCPSEIGTQVVVVPVEGDAEHPVVVARIFDISAPPPVSPATGQPVQPGEVGIFSSNGNYIHVTGDAIYIKGKIVVDGTVQVDGDVTAGGVSLISHIHRGVQPGNGFSGAPQASDG